MTRVGQRTEKRRTIYSPPLSRGHSDGSSYPGERGAGKMAGEELNRSPKKILKIPSHPPPAMLNPIAESIPDGVPLDRWPAEEEPGVRPSS